MTYDDLKANGYRQQPDGSWARRPARAATPPPGASRPPDAKPQPDRAKALDGGPAAQGRGAGRVVVRITRIAPRLLDPDNLAGGCKFLIDELRKAALIPNDDPASIELVTAQQGCRRGEERTEIELNYPA